MDGAPCNRNVWTTFGITEKMLSTAHPYDDDCGFVYAYPLLLKCMRNCLAKN